MKVISVALLHSASVVVVPSCAVVLRCKLCGTGVVWFALCLCLVIAD